MASSNGTDDALGNYLMMDWALPGVRPCHITLVVALPKKNILGEHGKLRDTFDTRN